MPEMGKKLRYSRQRELIYSYLLSTQEHPSAEMVYERLRDEIANISLGTVYRNLRLLERMGKVRRVGAFQNTERYDARCDNHAHFLCERCGRMQDLSTVDIQSAMRVCKVEAEDRVTWVALTFGGLCRDCLRSAESDE
ncbi:MAG: transcriptional repressor [Fretibacterium sp.]|nr:transcriptional repressor [Fretibacterium sp.]